MKPSILVPLEAKPLFEESATRDVQPVFYRAHDESLARRVLRALGIERPAHVLATRLGIVEGDGLLTGVIAAWLSPEAWFPLSQTTELLDALPKLKWVYTQTAGTDHLNFDAFRARGVAVSNNGRLHSRRVAEMALTCILAHAKRLPTHLTLQRERRWRSLPSDDVEGRTLGIIGTGNIGGELARLCRAIGMHVIGASRNPSRFGDDPNPYHQVLPLQELQTVVAHADYVALTLPLTRATEGLIGRQEFRHMKRHAALINVARGAIVDEDALCNALSHGWIGAAYIDRTTRLPPARWSRLYRAPNLVLTHYSAANHDRALEEAFGQFVAGLTAVLERREAPHRVA